MRRLLSTLLATIGIALAETPDPAYTALDHAYAALRGNNYEQAIAEFQHAAALSPKRADIRKDLGYTLLKIGENVAARDQFSAAMSLDPSDEQIALEFAFLCYETREPLQSRRVFDRLRHGNPVAAQAFENIDRPLREGIARWQEALAQSPGNFSAHEELAHLAEQRDDASLAAEHFEKAWRLRPARRDLLMDLGQVWAGQGRAEDSTAALLAASRGAEPRIAESARALLPTRYPYVYEFEGALALDPTNENLRRELAYLHVEMGNRDAANQQFEQLPERAPARPAPAQPILLERAEPPPDAKLMAERSLEKGYLQDAVRYLQTAHESDPADFGVMLKLGWTYNNLKQDREAIRWFDLARRSPDATTAAEATRAYANLGAGLKRFRTTVWTFPVISTRWRDTFAYAQAKTEWILPGVRPYLSARFIGDLRGPVQFYPNFAPVAGLPAQYLSERSVIVAAGLALPARHGATLWLEAGEAFRYRKGPGPQARPDFRGGLSYAKGITRPHRLFAETNDDALFISRFNNDALIYSQNRAGVSFSDALQAYWNANVTTDVKREFWANTAESGPGARWRFQQTQFSVNFLRGVYLKNQSNPYRPNYWDLRIGIWYAFSR
ncbi:MAG: tetratricopeptide repeat protein [Acidobacteriota bacterium]